MPKGQFVRHPRTGAEETMLTAKLAAVFSPSGKAYEPAVRYGRKLLRFADGRRASRPPFGSLSQAQAERVAAALGLAHLLERRERSSTPTPPAHSVEEGLEQAAPKRSGDVQVVPDPRPEPSPRSKAAREREARKREAREKAGSRS